METTFQFQKIDTLIEEMRGVYLPAGWSPTVRIGDGLSDWKVLVNGVPQ